VITPDTIEGWSVTGYKGIVSSYIVAAAGIFKDLGASFSVGYSGRSDSYGKLLRTLQAEIVSDLAEQGARIGANWVIGTRIDFDQLSAQGVQMFVATGLGTAVTASPVIKQQSEDRPMLEGAISPDEMESVLVRDKLVRSATTGQLEFTSDTWNALVEHQVEEALIPGLRYVVVCVSSYVGDAVRQDFVRLLSAVSVRTAQEQMHKAIVEIPDCTPTAVSLIQQHSLVDLTWVRDQLKQSDFRLQHAALHLLSAHCPVYYRSTLNTMAEIAEILPAAFPDKSRTVEKKASFASKGRTLWQCYFCDSLNELNEVTCGKCSRDRRGFLGTDDTPEMALSSLRARMNCLNVIFHQDRADERTPAVSTEQ
jgi:uncharacterized protein YbjQ (UPF0145 family)